MKRTKISEEEIKKVKKTKLPHGEGTIFVNADQTYIIYKKSYKGKSLRCTGHTVKEVLSKMKVKMKEVDKPIIYAGIETVEDGIKRRLMLDKKNVQKDSSKERCISTLKNQIAAYDIGKMRYRDVTGDDIRRYLNQLVDAGYSWSTIKKAYDLLRMFYRITSYEEDFKDPMFNIPMIQKKNVKKEEKVVKAFTEDEVSSFVHQASMMTSEGKPLYKYGFTFISLIYTGLRIGEMMALTWKDIDFEAGTIHVTKSVNYVRTNVYDALDEEELNNEKRQNIVGETKTYKSRVVYLSSNAKEALLNVRKYSDFTKPDDLVVPTKSGKHNNASNLYKSLLIIEERAGLDVSTGMHTLRHTFASLLYHKGVGMHVIAALLGNSVEVCQKIYVDIFDDIKVDAVGRLQDYGSHGANYSDICKLEF